MIKIGKYLKLLNDRRCDSCGNMATKKVYAENNNEKVAIRLCDNCLDNLIYFIDKYYRK